MKASAKSSQTGPKRAGSSRLAAKVRTDVRGAGGRPVQSLVVGLSVIEALAAAGRPRGMTELAGELGYSKWQMFRHLHSLAEEGYVSRDEATGKFGIGRRTYALMGMLPRRFSFMREAQVEMAALRDLTGHTVVLAVPVDEGGVVVVDVAEGLRDVQFSLKVGATFGLHASAHGKLALAYGPAQWLERVIASGLKVQTPFTIAEPAALRLEIARVREAGWAAAPEEWVRGLTALAAPVFASDDRLVATIAIFGAVDDIGRESHSGNIKAVVDAARCITQQLRQG